jgi:hypothetical protein
VLFVIMFVLLSVSTPVETYSKDLQSGCITHTRLLGLRGKTLSGISSDLRRARWTETNSTSDLNINIDGNDLLFYSSEWMNTAQSSNNTLNLYSIDNKVLVVSHFPEDRCFDLIFNYFSRLYGSRLIESSTSDGMQYVYQSTDVQIILTKQYYTTDRVDIYDMKRINVIIEEEKKNALIRERLNTLYTETVDAAEELHNQNKFDEAIKLFEKAKTMTEVADSDYLDSRITDSKAGIRSKYVESAEKAFQMKEYDKVIELYKLADNYSDEYDKIDFVEIEEKIRISKLNDQIQDLISRGDEFYAKKQFSQALQMYQKASELGDDTSNLKGKIRQSQEMIQFLRLRSTTVFDYNLSQPSSFNFVKSSLESSINQAISKWNNGIIRLTYATAFDTLGRNTSDYQLEFSTITNFSKELDAIKMYKIDPTKQKDYYIASKSTIAINANWNSQNYRLKYQPSSSSGQIPYSDRVLDRVILSQYPYGKYYYRVKEKSLNSEQGADVQIYGHRSMYGPQYALLSVLVPGLGSGILTQGEIGFNRFFWVGALIGGYFAGQRGTEYYLEEAAKETDTDTRDTLIEYADIADKASFVSLGLAGAVYLFDIVWTLDKGFKNLKVSSKVNERLRQQPVNVVQSQLKLW